MDFNAIPESNKVRAFGVPYAHLKDPEGGDLYITKDGWSWASYLLPDVWFRDGRFHKEGIRLTGGTGTVYRIKLSKKGEPRVELVVKFCRFAEYVPLFMPSTLPDNMPPHLADQAKFNSPFEEFGLTEDMRRGRFGSRKLRIKTKRPLAIYCCPTRFPLWQLGRTPGRFSEYELAMKADQSGQPEEKQIRLDIQRQYIMLFGWVYGYNAEDLFLAGKLSKEDLENLTHRVNRELAEKGFRILDNKPKHFILRQKRNGELMRDNGELIYVQVDFELLQRTEEYQIHLKQRF